MTLAPPDALSEKGNALWTGKMAIPKPDGQIDRSETLFALAGELLKSGSEVMETAGLIGGWDSAQAKPKFAGRPDRDQRYFETAVRAADAIQLVHEILLDEEPGSVDLTDLKNTDAGNAEALSRLYAGRLTFDAVTGRWLAWGGHTWRAEQEYEVYRLALQTAKVRQAAALEITDLRLKQEAVSWAIKSEDQYRLKAAVEATRWWIAEDGEWNADRSLMGCANGVIDLKTGQARSGRQQDRITLSTNLSFDLEAKCPRWEQFLSEVFDGDDELTGYVRRAIGYSLTGNTTEQCLFLCHGFGANGKSTLLSVLRSVLGDYAANTPFDTLVETGSADSTNGLAALAGSRLITSSEVSEQGRLNEARIKAITGGDPITARFLYKEFFTFTPQFKLWLTVNHLPAIRGDDDGIWRRIKLVPFTQSFKGREDRELEETLRGELPGILAWAVRGCLEWQEHGLGEPEAVRKATAKYRTDSDIMNRFLEDHSENAADGEVTSAVLYQKYSTWCEREGEYCLSSTKFGRRLSERGYTTSRSRTGARCWNGIKLKSYETQ